MHFAARLRAKRGTKCPLSDTMRQSVRLRRCLIIGAWVVVIHAVYPFTGSGGHLSGTVCGLKVRDVLSDGTMALVAYGELPEDKGPTCWVCAAHSRNTRWRSWWAVLLHHCNELDVVACESEFFEPLIRVIAEMQGSLTMAHFIMRPATSSTGHLFIPGFTRFNATRCLAAGDLMVYCGKDDATSRRGGLPSSFVMRSAERPSGFFDGPAVHVEAAICLVDDPEGCARNGVLNAWRWCCGGKAASACWTRTSCG